MRFDETSELIHAIEDGDEKAADKLLVLLYEELRLLARQKLAKAPDHSLDATGLVHEAYLRLVCDSNREDWKGRRYFFAAAAEAMRRTLIDRARAKQASKRGGQFERHPIGDSLAMPSGQVVDEVLAVHDVLDELAKIDPDAAELVKLRYFAQFTIPEVADALGISARNANAIWAYAKAWLHERLKS